MSTNGDISERQKWLILSGFAVVGAFGLGVIVGLQIALSMH